ncbi:MAG TPA: malto-oligosyltrehalose trehalohydrolase [Bryobacteraceae bacterium]|nr:malto-oligosyltrehalose trehalohydrolase [Bryobacteraceae bacterium]
MGAEVQKDGGVHFRVWAPEHESIEVVTGSVSRELDDEGNGYYSGRVEGLAPGSTYRLRIDGGDSLPDPASRFQPEGPHGPSAIVDASRFRWSDQDWKGISLKGQVIYEMHIGTFSHEGTWTGALEHLPELARIGITVLEVMPVADFSGSFGWGYDGVNWYAPSRLYGSPDDCRTFIDRAHSLGMAVILDVVYNHFGSDGNYVCRFSPHYLSTEYKTDWGEGLNYDGKQSQPVREYVVNNAAYWIDEFHFDGLRLDATQDICDKSPTHILVEVTAAVRSAAGNRETIVIAENEPQHSKLARPVERGGYGMDGLWNDDFHHSAIVALTGRREAYYSDYYGQAQEFVSALKYGYLFQGQWYKWQRQRRGRPAFQLDPWSFVTFIQNHDQIANSARGQRIHELTSPGLLRAATALMLLGPGTPMLFQGQEFAASAPFLYFADVPDCLRKLVEDGRKEFLAQFRNLRLPEMVERFTNPCTEEAFLRCKLDHSERQRNAQIYRLHCDLLDLRRKDPVLREQRRFDGAVLSNAAFCFRVFNEEFGDRLLVINLGPDLNLDAAPEPLLAPPEDQVWSVALSTESPEFGGFGTPPVDSDENWRIPGFCGILLRPVPAPPATSTQSQEITK